MRELTCALCSGTLPDRAISVTFDDGYADTLFAAKPLLECCEIPATVFVVTGYLAGTREYWWDELEQLLLGSEFLPEQLRLELPNGIMKWKVERPIGLHADERAPAHAPLFAPAIRSQRLKFYYSVWESLRPLSAPARESALTEIAVWAKALPEVRPTSRPMTADELCVLEQGGLIDIGAHTVTHPLLTAHSLSAQEHEIRASKRCLEEVIGRPVSWFSYPFGAYSPITVPVVRNAGFECAVGTNEDTVGSDTGLFELPRFYVDNWGGEQFEKRLLKLLRC
jgi:peptidoglycan/xylan/chitin deacetylase (PgdA/CDA1 family)